MHYGVMCLFLTKIDLIKINGKMENLWNEVKTQTAIENYRNMDELWAEVQKAWYVIPKSKCQVLVESMGRRFHQKLECVHDFCFSRLCHFNVQLSSLVVLYLDYVRLSITELQVKFVLLLNGKKTSLEKTKHLQLRSIKKKKKIVLFMCPWLYVCITCSRYSAVCRRRVTVPLKALELPGILRGYAHNLFLYLRPSFTK